MPTWQSSANGDNKTAGTTIVRGFVTPFVAGSTYFLWVIFDNLTATTPAVSSAIAKAPGETNNWEYLGQVNSPQANAGAGVRGQLWRLDATVTGDLAADAVFVTLTGSVTAKALSLVQITGGVGPVSGTPQSASGDGTVSITAGGYPAGGMYLECTVTEDPNPPVKSAGLTMSNSAITGTSGGSRTTNVAGKIAGSLLANGTFATTQSYPIADGGVLGISFDAPGPAGTPHTASPADDVAITDNVDPVVVLGATRNDPVSITDAVALTRAVAIAPADPVGITDSVAAGLVKSVAVGDPVGITDSVTAILINAEVRNDPVAITDAVTTTTALARTQDDPVGITDQVTPVASASRSIADPVGITDQVATARGTTAADNVAITDTVAATLINAHITNDPVGITDTVRVDRGQGKNDPVGITDAVATAQGRAVADPVGITDTVTTQASAARPVTDAVSITDSVNVSLSGSNALTIPDPVGIADAVALVSTRQVPRNDPVGITDVVTVTIGRGYTEADNDPVGITDAVSMTWSRGETLADAVPITDDVSVELVRVLTVEVTDPVAITDTVIDRVRPQIDYEAFCWPTEGDLVGVGPSATLIAGGTGSLTAVSSALRLSAVGPRTELGEGECLDI